MTMRLILLQGGPHHNETRITPAHVAPGEDYWVFSHYTKCPDGWTRHQITVRPHHYRQDPNNPDTYHYQEQ